MLILAHSLRQLRFGELMGVYLQGNQEKAEWDYPEEPAGAGLRLAEEDFYRYLRECFFYTPAAVYAVWEEGGSYVSALRVEPYRDGVLVNALETAPGQRRKGYASRLLGAVLETLDGPVYSHVAKSNIPSLALHQKLGFWRIQEAALYLDGSVDYRACTLRWMREEKRLEIAVTDAFDT